MLHFIQKLQLFSRATQSLEDEIRMENKIRHDCFIFVGSRAIFWFPGRDLKTTILKIDARRFAPPPPVNKVEPTSDGQSRVRTRRLSADKLPTLECRGEGGTKFGYVGTRPYNERVSFSGWSFFGLLRQASKIRGPADRGPGTSAE